MLQCLGRLGGLWQNDSDGVKRWLDGVQVGHPIEETRGPVPSKADRERERLRETMNAAETQGE